MSLQRPKVLLAEAATATAVRAPEVTGCRLASNWRRGSKPDRQQVSQMVVRVRADYTFELPRQSSLPKRHDEGCQVPPQICPIGPGSDWTNLGLALARPDRECPPAAHHPAVQEPTRSRLVLETGLKCAALLLQGVNFGATPPPDRLALLPTLARNQSCAPRTGPFSVPNSGTFSALATIQPGSLAEVIG